MPHLYFCQRCKTAHSKDHCPECGTHKDRVVRKIRRRSKIGGKRGRNSGTTSSAKNKGG